MIFARYVGSRTSSEFTCGRVYLADPAVGRSGMVDYEKLRVTDDQGRQVEVSTDDGMFEFPKEVMAVTLSSAGDLDVGEVTTIDDISADGEFFHVKDEAGFFRVDMFQVLDSMFLSPGSLVKDPSTDRWARVTRVNERSGDGGGVRHFSFHRRFPIRRG